MNSTHFDPWLADAVTEVVESMCFMSAEVVQQMENEAETQWISRRLEFQGTRKGSFGIHTPLPTARLLATNFLGEESEEPGDMQVGEVVGEIANMICGSFLGRIDSKEAFTLSPPYNDAGMPQDLPDFGHTCLSFSLDDGALVAWFNIESKL